MQSKKHSLLESVVKVAFGLCYSVPLNYVLINKVQWSDPWTQSVIITLMFTVLSISLSYMWRRIFNDVTMRQIRSGRPLIVNNTCPTCGQKIDDE